MNVAQAWLTLTGGVLSWDFLMQEAKFRRLSENRKAARSSPSFQRRPDDHRTDRRRTTKDVRDV